MGAGGAHERRGRGVAVAGEREHGRGIGHVAAEFAHLPDQAGAACDGLEAAAVAARARFVEGRVDLCVGDVAGGGGGAAVDLAAHDNAAADGRACLHGDAVFVGGEPPVVFAERHEVGVVVDDDGGAEEFGEPVAHAVPLPAGHARWLVDTAGFEPDGAGQRDAGGPDVAPGGEFGAAVGDAAQRVFGAAGDVDRDGL